MKPTYNDLRALRPNCGGEESLTIRGIVRRFFAAPEDTMDPFDIVNMNPDYQRGSVWTDDQCSRFIGFLAEGGTAPPVWIQRWPDYLKPDELLDGLQRITAIRRFSLNEVPMELTDGTKMFLQDFSEADQKMWVGNAGMLLSLKYVKYETRADVLRFYIRLNRGGTVHEDSEIDRVRELLSKETSK